MAAGAAPHAAGRRVRICRLPGPVPQPHAERTAQPQPHAAGRAQTTKRRRLPERGAAVLPNGGAVR